jgi:alkylated DNA repair dioxygenase AlkB
MKKSVTQADLFGDAIQPPPSAQPAGLPEGFVYEAELLTREEEAALLAAIRALPLAEAKYKEYTARRRTVSYGGKFDYTNNVLRPTDPIPSFLMPLRGKVAAWVGLPADDFVHGLVSEYRPGTPLGWHRDVPDFEAVVGVSLGGAARMKLRPYKPGERNFARDVIALELPPRSAYSIRGVARWGWQHSIVATEELRYSITFRTSRK